MSPSWMAPLGGLPGLGAAVLAGVVAVLALICYCRAGAVPALPPRREVLEFCAGQLAHASSPAEVRTVIAALEALGQADPDARQAVLDVVCGYLRRPSGRPVAPRSSAPPGRPPAPPRRRCCTPASCRSTAGRSTAGPSSGRVCTSTSAGRACRTSTCAARCCARPRSPAPGSPVSPGSPGPATPAASCSPTLSSPARCWSTTSTSPGPSGSPVPAVTPPCPSPAPRSGPGRLRRGLLHRSGRVRVRAVPGDAAFSSRDRGPRCSWRGRGSSGPASPPSPSPVSVGPTTRRSSTPSSPSRRTSSLTREPSTPPPPPREA
jgi:hypothetical protein